MHLQFLSWRKPASLRTSDFKIEERRRGLIFRNYSFEPDVPVVPHWQDYEHWLSKVDRILADLPEASWYSFAPQHTLYLSLMDRGSCCYSNELQNRNDLVWDMGCYNEIVATILENADKSFGSKGSFVLVHPCDSERRKFGDAPLGFESEAASLFFVMNRRENSFSIDLRGNSPENTRTVLGWLSSAMNVFFSQQS
jgi:hypothetical protein